MWSIEKWVIKVIESAKKIYSRQMDPYQAKQRLLSKVDGMEYGNCYVVNVRRITEPSNLVVNEGISITAAANYRGLHVFLEDPPRHHCSVNLNKLRHARFANGLFYLKTSDGNVLAMDMDSSEGALLLELTETHRSDDYTFKRRGGCIGSGRNAPDDECGPSEIHNDNQEISEADLSGENGDGNATGGSLERSPSLAESVSIVAAPSLQRGGARELETARKGRFRFLAGVISKALGLVLLPCQREDS